METLIFNKNNGLLYKARYDKGFYKFYEVLISDKKMYLLYLGKMQDNNGFKSVDALKVYLKDFLKV